jgi:hypothetical protein
MSSKREFDYDNAIGDIFNDEIERRLIIDCLEDFDAEDALPTKQRSSAGNKLDGSLDKNRANIQ